MDAVYRDAFPDVFATFDEIDAEDLRVFPKTEEGEADVEAV